MVVVDIHRQQIVIAVTVVVEGDAVYQGALSTVVCILFNRYCLILLDLMHFILIKLFMLCPTVMVTGLPSSASWQDLKV